MKKITIASSKILLAALVAWGVAHAAKKVDDEQKNPLGCHDVGYAFDLKTVELLPEAAGAQQSMYFFYNKLDKPIKLFQMRGQESSRSLRLNHSIAPKQWGVLSLSESNARFLCAVDNPKYPQGEVIDCGQSVKVCEFTKVVYGLNNQGNFWMVNSNTRSGALRAVVHYGVIPAY